jgi:hypothetical protein
MAKNDARTNADRPIQRDETQADDDLGDEVEIAEDAITAMEARERRRNTSYSTSGDDHDPGIDSEIDSNAPKELRLPPNKRGKT